MGKGKISSTKNFVFITIMVAILCLVGVGIFSRNSESWQNTAILLVSISLSFGLAISQARSAQDSRQSRQANQKWLDHGKNKVVLALQNNQTMAEICQSGLTTLAEHLDVVAGYLYLPFDRGCFLVEGVYGISEQVATSHSCQLGEGPVGLAIQDKTPRVISGGQSNELTIKTGFGPIHPHSLVIYPLINGSQVFGCLELALTRECSPNDLALLDNVSANFCAALAGATSQEKALELLKVTQNQAKALERSRVELNEKAEALTKASMYKSQFMANMSHELRTPLNSVMILAQMIAEKPTPIEQVQENAKTIEKCGQELLNLINDVLDLSKVEAGKIEYHLKPLDLDRFLHSIDSSQGPVARQKGLEFQIEIMSSTSVMIMTDTKRLRQIVRNLVGNAIKFTAKGKITLQASLTENPNIPGPQFQLEIRVRDTGIGIAPEKHQSIFEEFEQADARTDQIYGGTGLGLSISRKLAQGLGGTLNVESSLGEGSTFTLQLPVVAAHEESPQPLGNDDSVLEEKDLLELAKEVGHIIASTDSNPITPPPESIAPAKEFAGRSILILGPDMRRVFALMAEIETAGAQVKAAADCPGAVQMLDVGVGDGPTGWDLAILDLPHGVLNTQQYRSFLEKATHWGVPVFLRGPHKTTSSMNDFGNDMIAGFLEQEKKLSEWPAEIFLQTTPS